MPVKILLTNVHSLSNAGDAALTQVVVNQLKANFPGCQLTIMANDPASYIGEDKVVKSFLSWVTQAQKFQAARFLLLLTSSLLSALIFRFFGKKLIFSPSSSDLYRSLNAYFDANLIVSAPGGYFFSYGKGRAFLVIVYTLCLAIFAGMPIYMFPATYGPLTYKRERILARYLLSRVRTLMIREEISRAHLVEWGIPQQRVTFVPDVALGFKGAEPNKAIDFLQTNIGDLASARPLLGVTAIDWNRQFQGFAGQSAYEDALAASVRHFLNQHHGKLLLIPQSCGPSSIEDDRIPLRRIAGKLLEHAVSVVFIDQELPLDLLWALYGQLDLLFGTRMHSNIFALSQGVPVLPIGYLHKTLGIARYLGIEGWVVDIRQIDSQELITKVDSLWEKRDLVKNQINKLMSDLIPQSTRAGVLIAQDYRNYIEGKLHG